MIVHLNLYMLLQERPERPSQLRKPGCQPKFILRPIRTSSAPLETALKMLDHDHLSYNLFHNNWILNQTIVLFHNNWMLQYNKKTTR